MGNFVFCIPSYNSVDKQNFLKYAIGLGYKKEELFLQVQNERDYAEYSARYGSVANVCYSAAKNAAQNKNNALRSLSSKNVVIVSDKVEAVFKLDGECKGKKIDTRKELDRIVDTGFAICKNSNVEFWGVYLVENYFFMSNSIQVNNLLLGCFMGFPKGNAWFFDEELPLKDDYEICLRAIAYGKKVFRFNNICLKERFHQKGGCYEMWNAEGDSVNRECTQRIIMCYPDLVKEHPKRKNEIKYIGETKKIKFTF